MWTKLAAQTILNAHGNGFLLWCDFVQLQPQLWLVAILVWGDLSGGYKMDVCVGPVSQPMDGGGGYICGGYARLHWNNFSYGAPGLF